MIDGIVLKDLQTYTDERGFFREIIRSSDSLFAEGFGQFSHSMMYPGVAKAWHIHPHQVDWWYVPIGVLKVALMDRRIGSPTEGELMELFLGEIQGARVLKIPPGVAHGCKAIGGVTHLFYITSMIYDPKEEGRIAHDDAGIGYDWAKGALIK
jgi:dTDP-4-dehydrorhamnose 3,5-epimerase